MRLPRKKWQAPRFFQKTHKLDQNCCCKEENNKPVYLAALQLKLFSFHSRKILFASRPQFPGSQNMFACILELCKETPRKPWNISWEKRSGESVLWVLTAIPIVTLIWWNCANLQTRSGKQHVSFRKLKIYTKAVVVMKSKISQCVFMAGLRL